MGMGQSHMSLNPVTGSWSPHGDTPQGWGTLSGWLQVGSAQLCASVSLCDQVCQAPCWELGHPTRGAGRPRMPGSASPGHLAPPGQGLPPAVLSWHGITLIPARTQPELLGSPGLAPRGQPGVTKGCPRRGGCCWRGALRAAGLGREWPGVTHPQGAPLTLLIHLLQPLSHQDGEWPRVGGSRRRWEPCPTGHSPGEPRQCRARPRGRGQRGELCPPAA